MDSLSKLFRHNLRIFYIFDFTRALIFHGAVWVAFERQFISASELVFIEGIILGSQLLLELPTGAFADLFGRRTSVASGFLVSAAAMVLFGFSTTFQMFFLYALLVGLSEALISGAREALLYDTFKEAHQESLFIKVSASLSFIFQTSLAIATIIGGYFGSFDIRLPIWLYAGAQFITAIITFAFLEPHIDSEKFTVKSYVRQMKNGFAEISKTPHIKKISLFYVLVAGISWPCMLVFNYTVLNDLGFTIAQVGIILGSIRFLNSAILLRMVHLDQFFTRSKIYLIFPVVLIASLLPGIFLRGWIAIPFVMGSMFTSTARWVILSKYTNGEFDSRNRATAISSLSMLIGIFYVVSVWASGPIIEWWGNSTIIYTIFGIISIIAVLPLGVHLSHIHKNDSV